MEHKALVADVSELNVAQGPCMETDAQRQRLFAVIPNDILDNPAAYPVKVATAAGDKWNQWQFSSQVLGSANPPMFGYSMPAIHESKRKPAPTRPSTLEEQDTHLIEFVVEPRPKGVPLDQLMGNDEWYFRECRKNDANRIEKMAQKWERDWWTNNPHRSTTTEKELAEKNKEFEAAKKAKVEALTALVTEERKSEFIRRGIVQPK